MKNKRLNRKVLITGITVIILLIIATVVYFNQNKITSDCSSGICDLEGNENIVAEYNGNKITQQAFNKDLEMMTFLQGIPSSAVDSTVKIGILNQSIITNLLYAEAEQTNNVTTEESNKEFNNIITRNGLTIDEFKTQLENNSFSYDDVIEFNRKQMTINNYINDTIISKVNVSDDEISKYYDENKNQFEDKAKINASHILVNTSEEAKEIIKELDNGSDFAELAKNKSIGPSASRGGNLGFFSKGMMVPAFENAAFALENIGDYTKKPVKTEYGYHIIELMDKKDAHQKTLDEAENEIKQLLTRNKVTNEITNKINSVVNKAAVKINLKETTPEKTQVVSSVKTDKPIIELFVMSYCPYGTQIEKAIIPVLNTLKNNIDFKLEFVNYSMHGEKEVTENLRQYCIEKDQNDKLVDYLSCFLKAGDSANCLTKTNIDNDKLTKCVDESTVEFNVTYYMNNPVGKYPYFMVNNEGNLKYGVRGSPTFVLNGKEFSVERKPSAILSTICSSFNTAPKECDTVLSSEQPGPGFGFDSTATTTSASCGE